MLFFALFQLNISSCDTHAVAAVKPVVIKQASLAGGHTLTTPIAARSSSQDVSYLEMLLLSPTPTVWVNCLQCKAEARG